MGRIRIAVTGAAGQIGSVLVRRMCEFPNINTIAICRNPVSAGIIHSASTDADIRIGSITEIDTAKKLLGDADIIIHCALAMISGNPKKSLSLNKTMVDSFSSLDQLKLIVHVSSLSVYGGCISNSKSTFEKPCPDSDYGRSKLRMENYFKEKFLRRKINYYILRIGHVYGAKMDRSRQIIDLAQNPYFRLPYNGNLPANSIHIENLASKIIALVLSPTRPGTYNVSEKKTWRQIFDWHTQALELTPVKGLSEQRSEQLKSSYNSATVINESISWLRTVPILSLLKYPSIFDNIFRSLYFLPVSATDRLRTMYKRLEVKHQISEIKRQNNMVVSPVYLSEAMPGEYLKLSEKAEINLPPSEELINELRNWYFRYANSNWLPNSLYE
ncbi:MAG: NAD-dependent epimerase/dehydratase family protein [Candidatus Hodarchaeota archaeon]